MFNGLACWFLGHDNQILYPAINGEPLQPLQPVLRLCGYCNKLWHWDFDKHKWVKDD